MTNLIIIGTGALALLFGSRLAAAGIDISILGTWVEGLDALEKEGIRVAFPDGEQSYPVRVFKDPAELPESQYALVLVKSWQTERAAKQLTQLLSSDGVALTLQNGFGNVEILSNYLGEERTAQGITTYGATLLKPGLVRPGGEGLISLQEHPRLSKIAKLFQQANLAVQMIPDLTSMIWGKLVINAAINPVSALLGVKNGQLLESSFSKELMAMVALETAQVGQAVGVEFTFSDPVQAVEAVAEATAENKSSMLQDIIRGAPTEIDVLCGAVVELGRKYGVDTPYNHMLWNLVKARVEFTGNQINEDS